MRLYVSMNDDSPHQVAKDLVTQGYDIDLPGALAQWVVWILEINHVYAWESDVWKLGGCPNLKWIALRETFW